MEHVPSRNKLMRQIMEYDFVVNELVLFLDTHPNDVRALRKHEEMAQKARAARALYEQHYGPISPSFPASGDTWQWIENPWPWDIQ